MGLSRRHQQLRRQQAAQKLAQAAMLSREQLEAIDIQLAEAELTIQDIPGSPLMDIIMGGPGLLARTLPVTESILFGDFFPDTIQPVDIFSRGPSVSVKPPVFLPKIPPAPVIVNPELLRKPPVRSRPCC